MKTKLISRLTLMGLLLSAALVSGTALADESGYRGHDARTEHSHFERSHFERNRFDRGSRHQADYHHHYRSDHGHYRHDR
jgi:hypothetical protein